MIKSTYISNILDLLLDGDELGLRLRRQKDFLIEANYEYTHAGVFVGFLHDKGIEDFRSEKEDLKLNGVIIRAKDIEFGAEAILHFKYGLASSLEIWSHSGHYPTAEPAQYSMKQEWTGSPGREIIVDFDDI